MAIFHYTVKIVGRSKGKSIISASAYLNGDVMKNEETGRISYYTSKKEVVYTSLMMCENAPQEWQNVPAENIRRFQKSARYKRADNKEAALKKFKLTFQKQRLWNEVLRIEKSSDAQLGRSFEFSIPKEWNRQEQIDYTTEYIQKTFVGKGMCADWSIHDKGDSRCAFPSILNASPFHPHLNIQPMNHLKFPTPPESKTPTSPNFAERATDREEPLMAGEQEQNMNVFNSQVIS